MIVIIIIIAIIIFATIDIMITLISTTNERTYTALDAILRNAAKADINSNKIEGQARAASSAPRALSHATDPPALVKKATNGYCTVKCTLPSDTFLIFNLNLLQTVLIYFFFVFFTCIPLQPHPFLPPSSPPLPLTRSFPINLHLSAIDPSAIPADITAAEFAQKGLRGKYIHSALSLSSSPLLMKHFLLLLFYLMTLCVQTLTHFHLNCLQSSHHYLIITLSALT